MSSITSSARHRSTRSSWLVVTLLTALLAVGILAVLVGDRAIQQRSTVERYSDATDLPAVVAVEIHEFGLAIPVVVNALRRSTPQRVRLPPGVVTATPEVETTSWAAGDELMRVNDLPVILAPGTMPAYRNLTSGDTGDDIFQLQALLAELGYIGEDGVQGVFNASTRTALRELEADLGLPRDDARRSERIAFLPAMPFIVEEPPAVGSPAPESIALRLFRAGDIEFSAIVDPDPRIARNQRVVVDELGVVLEVAEIGSGAGQLELGLRVAPDSSCGQACQGTLPLGVEPASVVGSLEIVAFAEGLGVPVAALSSADGAAGAVVTAEGERCEVEVLDVQDGLARVDPAECSLGPGSLVRVSE